MQFVSEMRRLFAGMLFALLVVVLMASYLAIFGPDTLLERDDNPRLVEAIAAIDRGDLFDRDGRLLVTSERVSDESREMSRRYLYPALNGTVGYYSLRYGEGGAEAAYNDLLTGEGQSDDLMKYFEEGILHQPQVGGDARLTIDLVAQQILVDALQEAGCAVDAQSVNGGDGHSCAAVVLSVPDGGVLAMSSLPAYDPNVLDEQWEELVANPAQPFFNRALQGNYQPGTLSQLFLLTIGLVEQFNADTEYEDATDVVRVGEVAQVCITSPPSDVLTLREAFLHGCAAPFEDLISQIGLETISKRYGLFAFEAPPELPGLFPEDDSEDVVSTPESASAVGEDGFTLADAMGQGELTLTPLHMASLAAAYINGGNGIRPYLLMGTREPGSSEWTPSQASRPSIAITTPETARRMQEIMRAAVEDGIAAKAAQDGFDIGGYTGLASSGQMTQVWFVGWARMAARDGVVVAILMEDSDDLDRAAQAGGMALAAAFEARADMDTTTSP